MTIYPTILFPVPGPGGPSETGKVLTAVGDGTAAWADGGGSGGGGCSSLLTYWDEGAFNEISPVDLVTVGTSETFLFAAKVPGGRDVGTVIQVSLDFVASTSGAKTFKVSAGNSADLSGAGIAIYSSVETSPGVILGTGLVTLHTAGVEGLVSGGILNSGSVSIPPYGNDAVLDTTQDWYLVVSAQVSTGTLKTRQALFAEYLPGCTGSDSGGAGQVLQANCVSWIKDLLLTSAAIAANPNNFFPVMQPPSPSVNGPINPLFDVDVDGHPRTPTGGWLSYQIGVQITAPTGASPRINAGLSGGIGLSYSIGDLPLVEDIDNPGQFFANLHCVEYVVDGWGPGDRPTFFLEVTSAVGVTDLNALNMSAVFVPASLVPSA